MVIGTWSAGFHIETLTEEAGLPGAGTATAARERSQRDETMTAVIALRQPHSDWLARIRTIGLGLGGRGVMGLGLGRSAVSAAAEAWSPPDWWTVSGKTVYCAHQAKGAPSLVLSYTNLANPGTRNAGVGSAPSLVAGGWSFNGSQYLTTIFVPDADRSQTMLVQFSNHNGTQYTRLAGSWQGSAQAGRFWVSPTWGNAVTWENNYSSTPINAPATTSGNLGFAGTRNFRNGSYIGTGATGASLNNTFPVWIGGINNNGVLAGCVVTIAAFVLYEDQLSDAEFGTVAAAMAAL